MIKVKANAESAGKKILRFPSMMTMAARRSLQDATVEIVQIMRRSGLPVTYPIRWDSLKQKIYVIAKLRRERNLPYKRTGAYEQAWKSEAITGGFMVSNIGHKAVFMAGTATGVGIGGKVTATGQSHIHLGRWRLFRPVLVAVLSKVPMSLRESLRVEFNRNV